MAYVAPFIDASGLNIPTYQDIEDLLVQNAQTIFGSDIYLGNDSQDFQDIAARAKALYETMLTAQLAYNSRSPVSAVGTGLDGIVACNGLERHGATSSVASVTLTGTAFTNIINGIIADSNGNQWNLPASVILDAGGSAAVTATCQTPGPIPAAASTITIIITPTQGWTSVTNANAATPGQNIETDSQLRARQAISVSNPGQALTTGILGSVLSVAGVASAQLYENDTSAAVASINGVNNPSNYPAKSITVVVNGGADADVASAIAVRKTPGCYTNGSTSVVVVDQYNVPTTIRFTRPVAQSIDVSLTITPLFGYTSTVGDAIKAALIAYINALVAGQSVILSELWQASLAVDTGKFPVFSLNSLQAAFHGNVLGSIDLALDYNKNATIIIGQITLNVVLV